MAANGWLFNLPTGAALLLLALLVLASGLALLFERYSRVPTSEAQAQREAAFLRTAQHAQTKR